MPISQQVTVSSTVTNLVPVNNFHQTAYIHNSGGSITYIGGPDVTTANGYKLDGGDKLTIGIGDHEGLYAITASGTNSVSVLYQTN